MKYNIKYTWLQTTQGTRPTEQLTKSVDWRNIIFNKNEATVSTVLSLTICGVADLDLWFLV